MPGPALGVTFPCSLPADRLAPLVHAAERAGLDQVWLVEDCFYGGGIASAAAALAMSERITVGVGILPAVVRNAAFAAMEIATLANLYPGRLLVGFGHGVADWMRQVGAYPKSPLTALEEMITAVRALLAGETVTMTGQYVRLRDVRLDHPPATVPPILAGVRGPRSLALSGRAADGTILAEPAMPDYVRAAGRRIAAERDHLIVTYNWLALDDDPDRARQRALAGVRNLGPDTAAHLRPLPFGEELLTAIVESGSPDELAARLRPEWIDALTVSGTAETCLAGVRALHEAGSDAVVFGPPPGDDELDTVRAAGRMAELVRSDA